MSPTTMNIGAIHGWVGSVAAVRTAHDTGTATTPVIALAVPLVIGSQDKQDYHEAAVEEGRGVFDNLTKFIIWALPTNLGQGLVIMAAVPLGAVLPILLLGILWITMTAAVVLGLTAVFESREVGTMSVLRVIQPSPSSPARCLRVSSLPGRTSSPVLSNCFRAILLGVPPIMGRERLRRASSLLSFASTYQCAVSLIINVQDRRVLNPMIWFGIAVMAVLQLLYTYLPQMKDLFESAPIGAAQWGRMFLAGFAAYPIVGIEWWIRRRLT